MKLGMSSAVFYGRMETEDEASHLTDFPLEVCEIFLETYSEYRADFGAEVHKRLKGLPCVSVHPKGTQYEPDLFGSSRRQQEDALRLFCGVCDAGQAIGAHYYVFHGPGGVHGSITPDSIHALTERFPLMQQEAAKRGIELLWENVCWCALRRPQDIRRAAELLPGLGFVLDVKQAFRGGQDVFDMLTAMGEQVRHVHLLDWRSDGTLCLPGEGLLDVERLLRQLQQQGFDGAVMLEPYAAQGMDEDALRRSLDYLHEKIVAVG